MSEAEPFRIFVSYSRRDVDLVRPVVQLLRATRGLVFQDEDSLRAGQPWRPQIEQAIDTAHLVAVFWCAHSDASAEVRQEYERAIARRTGAPLPDVMPLLLDSTRLPDSLGAFHRIDFRAMLRWVHGDEALSAQMAPEAGPYYDQVVPDMVARLSAELHRRRGGWP